MNSKGGMEEVKGRKERKEKNTQKIRETQVVGIEPYINRLPFFSHS